MPAPFLLSLPAIPSCHLFLLSLPAISSCHLFLPSLPAVSSCRLFLLSLPAVSSCCLFLRSLPIDQRILFLWPAGVPRPPGPGAYSPSKISLTLKARYMLTTQVFTCKIEYREVYEYDWKADYCDIDETDRNQQCGDV